MDSFHGNLYDHFKDRHYGGIFWSTLLSIIASFALGAAIGLFNLQVYFPYLLPGIGLLAATWVWRSIRQARAERQKQLRRAPLSRDELRVARSKLGNGTRSIIRPVSRAPDTDLKY